MHTPAVPACICASNPNAPPSAPGLSSSSSYIDRLTPVTRRCHLAPSTYNSPSALCTSSSESATSSPLPLRIGISAIFFANKDAAEENSGGCCCCGVPSATLCAILDWHTVPVDCPSIVDVARKSEAPADGPQHCRTAAVCDSCSARLYSHSRSVVAPATVIPKGVWSLECATQRGPRCARGTASQLDIFYYILGALL